LRTPWDHRRPEVPRSTLDACRLHARDRSSPTSHGPTHDYRRNKGSILLVSGAATHTYTPPWPAAAARLLQNHIAPAGSSRASIQQSHALRAPSHPLHVYRLLDITGCGHGCHTRRVRRPRAAGSGHIHRHHHLRAAVCHPAGAAPAAALAGRGVGHNGALSGGRAGREQAGEAGGQHTCSTGYGNKVKPTAWGWQAQTCRGGGGMGAPHLIPVQGRPSLHTGARHAAAN